MAKVVKTEGGAGGGAQGSVSQSEFPGTHVPGHPGFGQGAESQGSSQTHKGWASVVRVSSEPLRLH